MSSLKKMLAKADQVLAGVAKAPVMKSMNDEQFTAHCREQFKKAQSEPKPAAMKRISHLQKQIAMVRGQVKKALHFEGDANSDFKIEMYNDDTTAADERSDKTINPVTPSPANQGFASNGSGEWVSKKGEGEDDEADEDDEKTSEGPKKDAPAEDKGAAAKPAGEKAADKPAAGGAGGEKATEGGGTTATEKIAKGFDDEGWPEDLNTAPVPKSWGFDGDAPPADDAD